MKIKKMHIISLLYAALFVGTAYTAGQTFDLRLENLARFPFLGYTPEQTADSLEPMRPTAWPRNFRGTQTNALTYAEQLDSLFARAQAGDTVSIVHIGDSHVLGNYFPHAVEAVLQQAFPNLRFSYIGINGARAVRFTDDDMQARIAAHRPNLVIISFGTNEAHAGFDATAHRLVLSTLADAIRQRTPQTALLFTTPPGSYISVAGRRWRDRRRRWHTSYVHRENPKTRLVADNIRNYAHGQGLSLWDLFTLAGGQRFACENWRNAGMMNTDRIHYTAEGYNLQGTLLGEAIVQAYRKYLADQAARSGEHFQANQNEPTTE